MNLYNFLSKSRRLTEIPHQSLSIVNLYLMIHARSFETFVSHPISLTTQGAWKESRVREANHRALWRIIGEWVKRGVAAEGVLIAPRAKVFPATAFLASHYERSCWNEHKFHVNAVDAGVYHNTPWPCSVTSPQERARWRARVCTYFPFSSLLPDVFKCDIVLFAFLSFKHNGLILLRR